MANSMTGFGRGEASRSGYRISIELKAVNHRFLEIIVRTPRHLTSFEEQIRKTLQGKFQRGRIEVYVNVVNLITMILGNVFNLFDRGFRRITPLFWLIWSSILLYRKPNVHTDLHRYFVSFLAEIMTIVWVKNFSKYKYKVHPF